MHKRKKTKQATPLFEHKARTHFNKRWRERVGTEPLDFTELKRLMQQAATGKPQTFLTFVKHVPPHSSRWRAKFQGKDLILVFDHAMRVPVSCWIDVPQETKLEAEQLVDA